MPDEPRRLRRGRGIEISGLTRNNPAQPGANVVGMKSKDKPLHRKNDFTALLSSATDGHRHTMSLDISGGNPNGLTSFEFTSSNRLHDHKLRFNEAGDIEFFETNENVEDLHTHIVPIEDAISYVTAKLVRKNKSLSSSDARASAKALLDEIVAESSNVSMGNNNKKESEMTDEQKKALEAENASLKKQLSFNAETKKYFDSLTEEKQKEFLAKSDEDIKKEIEKAKSNPLMSIDLNGKDAISQELNKSDDEIPDWAKAIKEENAALKAQMEEKENDIKAKELGISTQLYKAINSIEDEDIRNKELEAIKNKTANKSLARTTISSSDGTEKTFAVDKNDKMGAHEQLENIGKDIMKSDPSLTQAQAYMKAAHSNPELYKIALQ